MKQSIHTQHFISLKCYTFQLYETSIIRLHNSEIQKGNYRAIAIHSAVKTYGRNIGIFIVKWLYDLLLIFLKYEAWWWLFHMAKTCTFLDLIQCCLWTDCPIGTYCINTMAMTHIKTGSQIFTYSSTECCMITMLQVGWPKNSGSAPSKCTIFCLVHSVHTGSGELSASCSVDTGISFLRCKYGQCVKLTTSSHIISKLRKCEAILLTPICFHSVYKDNYMHTFMFQIKVVFLITCHEGREEE